MTAGLEIINTSGTILIDENYANLAVRQSGMVTASTSSTGLVTITIAGLNSPMIAIAPISQQFTVRQYGNVSGIVRLQGRDQVQSTNFPYFAFDLPVDSGINSGLKVYNASGQLTFDSNLKYARVVDVFGGANEADWAGVRTYAAGRSYAVVELNQAFTKSTDSLGGGNYEHIGRRSSLKVVSNVVTTGFIRVYLKTDTINSPVITRNAASFAVIDVTGY